MTANAGALALFAQQGWIRDGAYTDEGLEAFGSLLEALPPIHKGKWGPIFRPLMSRAVPASIECVIVRDNKVLLTYRKDQFYDGYHTPGTYLGPRETWQGAASRVAARELGCDVKVERYLASFSNPENPRFHDLSNLVLCRLAGEPNTGEWFAEKPKMLPHHDKFWPVIESVLDS